MQKKIAVIKGDGIGPEVVGQAIHVLNAVAEHYQHHFHYQYGLMGADAIEKTGQP
ncbi:MAG TPA: isocitrate/isopropylmalate family dehydrogenase, partial [Flavihumibacter sp.]